MKQGHSAGQSERRLSTHLCLMPAKFLWTKEFRKILLQGSLLKNEGGIKMPM